jgi:hypothetical protein
MEALVSTIRPVPALAVAVPDKCPAVGREFFTRSTLATVADTTEAEVVAYEVPEGFLGVLENFGHDGPAASMAAATLVWKLRRGVQGLTAVDDLPEWAGYQIGALNPADWFPFRLIVPEKTRVALRVFNGTGAAVLSLVGLLKGFLIPIGWRPDGSIDAGLSEGPPTVPFCASSFGVHFGRSMLDRNLVRYGQPRAPQGQGADVERARWTWDDLFPR